MPPHNKTSHASALEPIKNKPAQEIFQRLPLKPEGQIRLLTILPGSEDDQVTCSLTVHRHETAEYRALSYNWGPTKLPEHLRKIKVEGIDFIVTTAQKRFLRYLRRPSEPVVCWMDAICINQLNTKERDQQVGKMNEIYENATECTVWLGVSNELTDRGMAFLEYWARQFIRVNKRGKEEATEDEGKDTAGDVWGRCYEKVHSVPDEMLRKFKKRIQARDHEDMSLLLPENWAAVKELASRPWWLRLWGEASTMSP
jgi:hypothetical protein